MTHHIKARPVPPMNADAANGGAVATNSTIVDPSLDPDPNAADPAAVVQGHFTSPNGTPAQPVFAPTGQAGMAPNSSSVTPQTGGAVSSPAGGFYTNNRFVQPNIPNMNYNHSLDSLGSVTQPKEPTIEWSDNDAGATVFTLKSSRMEYNRVVFHQDTYQQAARRFFKKIEADLRYAFKNTKEFSIRLKEHNDYPDREFAITCDAEIRHNYDVDTWHWWFLNELQLLVKRMDVK